MGKIISIVYGRRKFFVVIAVILTALGVATAVYIAKHRDSTSPPTQSIPVFEDYQNYLDQNKPQEAIRVLQDEEDRAGGVNKEKVIGKEIPICIRIKDIPCLDRIIGYYSQKEVPDYSDTEFDAFGLAQLYDTKGDTASALKHYKLHQAALKSQGRGLSDEQYFNVASRVHELEGTKGPLQ